MPKLFEKEEFFNKVYDYKTDNTKGPIIIIYKSVLLLWVFK